MKTTREDGTVGFSELKKLALSGKQYVHACNSDFTPTPAMALGTAVHAMVLGERHGHRVMRFSGQARRGSAWEAFEATHPSATILTAPEWERAKRISEAVTTDPVAREHLEGARFELPLSWDDDGIACSTSGIDIVGPMGTGDLKTTTTVFPDALQRQAFRMLYHCQLAFYRRGLRANGVDSPRLFLLCVETVEPFEVVVMHLSAELVDLADRTVSLWLSQLKTYRESNQWPGYAQAPLTWDVPAWMAQGDDE